jgi:chromosome segregation ATPase
MSECYTCKRPLYGAWNIIATDSLYEDARRCLDISDGYLLYTGSQNWILCYCNSCWQKYILSLSLISNAKQVNTLKEQNNSLQQQLIILHQQSTSLQQQLTISEQQHTSLEKQLTISRRETTLYENQLAEINEKYNKLSNISGIETIQHFIKQLTPSQIDALHSHTNFRIDTFEAAHSELQIHSSKQFTMSILMQLMSSVNVVTELQKNISEQMKQAKENVCQMLATAGVSKALRDTCIKPLVTEIEEIEASIQGWNIFSASLARVVEQRTSSVYLDIEVNLLEE